MAAHTKSMVGPHADVNAPSITDEELLILLRRGSSRAFETLCRRYEPRLYRVAMGIVRNQADAEDVVQEALLRAFTKIADFRGDACVYNWLVRIVINTSLMTLRKRLKRVMLSLDHGIEDDEPWVDTLRHPGKDAEAEAISREHSALLQDALEELPPSCKFLLTEWMSGNVSTTELASRSALTVPATKSRLLRGRQRVEVVLKSRLCSSRTNP